MEPRPSPGRRRRRRRRRRTCKLWKIEISIEPSDYLFQISTAAFVTISSNQNMFPLLHHLAELDHDHNHNVRNDRRLSFWVPLVSQSLFFHSFSSNVLLLWLQLKTRVSCETPCHRICGLEVSWLESIFLKVSIVNSSAQHDCRSGSGRTSLDDAVIT